MKKVHQAISSVLGIGYIGKGGGTVAALAAGLGLYGLSRAGETLLVAWLPILTVLLTGLGIWSATAVEPYWGKDDKKVVIDEVAGMCISVLFLPFTLTTLITGLVLFRFFDIVKPLYIRKLEKISGGLGVMLDDVAAGIYANVALQILIYFRFF